MRRPSYEASLKNRFIDYTEFYRSGGSFTRQRLSRQAGISLLSITLAYTFLQAILTLMRDLLFVSGQKFIYSYLRAFPRIIADLLMPQNNGDVLSKAAMFL